MRHLEDWLGAPLFERGGGRPRLLPHAQALARALDASLSGIDVACRRARRSAGPPTLVIAAIPSVAVCWLIPRLSEFRARHPEIAVRVIYAFHGIDYGEVDLAFVHGAAPVARPDTLCHDFLPEAASPMCSPAVREAMDGASLADAVDCVDFLHDADTTGWAHWFEREGLDPERVPAGTVFEDFNLLRAATLAGQGMALCPSAMLAEDLAAGRLVRLSDTAVDEHLRYWLIEREGDGAAAVAAAKAFTDWLFEARDAG